MFHLPWLREVGVGLGHAMPCGILESQTSDKL